MGRRCSTPGSTVEPVLSAGRLHGRNLWTAVARRVKPTSRVVYRGSVGAGGRRTRFVVDCETLLRDRLRGGRGRRRAQARRADPRPLAGAGGVGRIGPPGRDTGCRRGSQRVTRINTLEGPLCLGDEVLRARRHGRSRDRAGAWETTLRRRVRRPLTPATGGRLRHFRRRSGAGGLRPRRDGDDRRTAHDLNNGLSWFRSEIPSSGWASVHFIGRGLNVGRTRRGACAIRPPQATKKHTTQRVTGRRHLHAGVSSRTTRTRSPAARSRSRATAMGSIHPHRIGRYR